VCCCVLILWYDSGQQGGRGVAQGHECAHCRGWLGLLACPMLWWQAWRCEALLPDQASRLDSSVQTSRCMRVLPVVAAGVASCSSPDARQVVCGELRPAGGLVAACGGSLGRGLARLRCHRCQLLHARASRSVRLHAVLQGKCPHAVLQGKCATWPCVRAPHTAAV
jgi:hypothetical protein